MLTTAIKMLVAIAINLLTLCSTYSLAQNWPATPPALQNGARFLQILRKFPTPILSNSCP